MGAAPDLLASLNEQQREAVTHAGAPLLILAGPGSGKTTVITARIARLIEQGAHPSSILAVTFTNKAAREMLERVQRLIGATDAGDDAPAARGAKPHVSTFHSFGAYLLRRFSEEAGLSKDFQIYDADDQLSLLKQAAPSMDSAKAKSLLSGISAAKDHGFSADASDADIAPFVFRVDAFRAYEQAKKASGNVDFGDLLVLPYRLLKHNARVREAVRRRWQHFLVDEYQDTNRVQFLLLQELCEPAENICAVGDDDQSIYKFRGAAVENILTFPSVFSGARVVKLEQNYRSTPQILEVANAVIAPNKGRHGKRIFSALSGGARPLLARCADDLAEQGFVVDAVREALARDEACAIFFRTNAQSRGYETALRSARIAYTLVGATGFFQRAEVKDTLALARVFRNPNDAVSFLRIANKPPRGIGEKSLAAITELMREGAPWMSAVHAARESLSSSARAGCDALAHLFAGAAAEQAKTIGQVCEFLVRRSGILDLYKKEGGLEAVERVRTIDEFLSYAFDFENTDEGWVQFLEQISLAESAPREESSKVQLMTLHRSKGLEFDRVIICGVEEDTIPMTYMADERSSLEETIEEERRLFYVGITRAKKRLLLTEARVRRRYGATVFCTPSRFLSDIEACIDTVDVPDRAARGADEEFAHEGRSFVRREAPRVPRANVAPLEAGEKWKEGERVHHKDYGHGVVRAVREQGIHTVLRVEFDNEFEGDFMPRFDSSIRRA